MIGSQRDVAVWSGPYIWRAGCPLGHAPRSCWYLEVGKTCRSALRRRGAAEACAQTTGDRRGAARPNGNTRAGGQPCSTGARAPASATSETRTNCPLCAPRARPPARMTGSAAAARSCRPVQYIPPQIRAAEPALRALNADVTAGKGPHERLTYAPPRRTFGRGSGASRCVACVSRMRRLAGAALRDVRRATARERRRDRAEAGGARVPWYRGTAAPHRCCSMLRHTWSRFGA